MGAESKLEKKLRLGVEALGGACEKFVSPGKRGVPDRLVSWPAGSAQAQMHWSASAHLPAVEFIETKAPGGELEPWQERDHARRRAMGFQVHVLWNGDQIKAYLKSRGKQ